MKNKFITIGLVQTKVSTDIKENIKKTVEMIGVAVKKGAKIIALQELFQTPYFPQWEGKKKDNYAETLEGYTVTEMKKAAKKFGVCLIVPIYEKKAVRYYNTAIVIDHTGKIIGQYHKIHIPHDPGFYEKEYFEHSTEGYKIFKVNGVKFAVLICYDQWFPEAAREARLAGAEIIFYPTAIGNIIGYKPEGDWHEAWETSMRGHAIANSVHVAAINRVGTEGRVQFFGQSFVSDPFGKVLKRATSSKEEVLVTKIDLERNRFFEQGWGFLRNRRPDTYKNLTTNKLVKNSKKLPNVDHYKDEKRALKG